MHQKEDKINTGKEEVMAFVFQITKDIINATKKKGTIIKESGYLKLTLR